MTRGKKPEAAIAEAKGFAQRMGYLTMDNRPDDLMFDFLIYKHESVRAVKVRQTRYHIDPNGYYDQQFPNEIRGLRSFLSPRSSCVNSGCGPSMNGLAATGHL